MTDRDLTPMKATVIDDDAFRLLALPYGGPIPYPGAPRGADLDRQWLEESTDFGEFLRPPGGKWQATWHHGMDAKMGKAVIADLVDPEFDDDGGWVTVWLRHGERRVNLVKRLAEKGAQLFGSSEAVEGSGRLRTGKAVLPWHRDIPGAIVRWHYNGQTLSTSPQNTLSVLKPMKATLADISAGTLEPTDAFFTDLAAFMDNLATQPDGNLTGDLSAKAGRVLAARNEARLREAMAALAAALEEVDRYVKDDDAG
jgi:hypothetical protein